MDQQGLKELEYRCIQQEPPWCTAACPIHVDVRAFVGHIGQGRWADGWKVLQRHMPLPEILGRICDAPCESRCKRGEAGEAIRIGVLERTCVQTEPPALRILPMPARGKRVAVAGSGLSSLTAAWDLARKGYAVTVFEAREQPGAGLRRFDPRRLPPDIIHRQIAGLISLGVVFELGCDPDCGQIASRCRESFDAVYLGLDAVSGRVWGVEPNDRGGGVRFDSKGRTAGRKGLFAGGQNPSPVWQTAQGRWAAMSIDRFLQDVSLTAGREKEGPFETRLFTSLKEVAPLPAVPLPEGQGTYPHASARDEAGRCLQCECMECVKVCAYLEKFGAYPKKYARQIYNNLSIVMGDHPANRMINSCSLCGLCEQVCPNNFAMQDLCLEARQTMVRSGRMPPAAHEFALLDMAFSRSDRFALARHQPGCQTSRYAFFPGCQLCASTPGQVEAVYAHLRSVLAGGVGLILGCCAAPAHWAGNQKHFENHEAVLRTRWQSLGKPRMILACSTCLQIFKEHLPMISAVPLWSVLDDHGPAVPASDTTRTLAVHDPCTTRREAGLRDCVRRLLDRAGVSVREMALGQGETECCGFGGLMQNANPELAREVAQRRAGRDPADYVAYCAMCRDNLAAAGKRVIHLLDLLFPDPRQADPALRPPPGWSLRQENRARLKAKLLECLWGEVPDAMERYQEIKLEISEEVAELMEQRRILVEDLQLVIHHAETAGDRFLHPPTGHYKAAYAPFKVTFWVEYSVAGKRYVVHNAYAHRMEVLGP
jgi:NADPH-dependent glutamate synthase beta subunit-like oxidoreductase